MAIAMTFGSCTRVRTTDAEKEREQWMASFNDSIEFYQAQNLKTEQELGTVSNEIASLLEDFEMVNNPKEVNGYYIIKGWGAKVPYTSTGIFARINDREKLELIATLAGATFNRLGVGEGSEEVFSETVPHDQAFNYRHKTYNTVCFSGGKADTVAEYIANHHGSNLNIDFLEGNTKKTVKLSQSDKDMITKTWKLYSAQLKAKELQKQLWISSKKIDTFRRLLDDGE